MFFTFCRHPHPGTVAYGVRPNGKSARAAGWGGAFLDGGSGYDIGQRALAATARAVDGRGPPTALLQAICSACGVGSNNDAMEGLLRFAYPAGSSSGGDGAWARVGALAACVVEAAAAGDAVANSILDDAAAELVGSLEAVCRQLDLGSSAAGGTGSSQTSPITVVLAGGLLQPGSAMNERVAGLCAQRLSHCQIVHAGIDPAIGAANLARQWLQVGSL